MKPISTNSNVSFNNVYILKKMQLSESFNCHKINDYKG